MQILLVNSRPFSRLLLVLSTAIFLLLTGCKLQINVPAGGTVQSESGAFICRAAHRCVIDVADLFFDETFTAQPSTGYRFSHWKEKPYRFCGGESTPCHLFTSKMEGSDPLLAILESDKTFYLEPVFVPIPGESGVSTPASPPPPTPPSTPPPPPPPPPPPSETGGGGVLTPLERAMIECEAGYIRSCMTVCKSIPDYPSIVCKLANKD